MYHKSQVDALRFGMKLIGKEVDPERLIMAARDAGIKLPVVGQHVSAPSMGGSGFGYTVPYDKLSELRGVIDTLISRGSRKAA